MRARDIGRAVENFSAAFLFVHPQFFALPVIVYIAFVYEL